MPDFLQAVQSGATHLWLFIPAAILLGALHGLEPDHSKTMMAAFIVAIRGTIGQAVLLGLAAAISHSLVIFGLALTMVATGALAAFSVQHAQQRFRGFGEAMRRAPYVSCVLLILLSLYMAWQGWQGLQSTHLNSPH